MRKQTKTQLGDDERLRLYNIEAALLRKCTVLADGFVPRVKFEFKCVKDTGISEKIEAPHEDPFTAFAARLRKFLLHSEEIEFGKISKLVLKLTHESHSDLHRSTEYWIEVFNGIPKMPMPMNVTVAGIVLNAQNCLDLYLNAELFHSNPEKQKLVEAIRKTPAAGMYYFYAKSALVAYIDPILNLDNIIGELFQRKFSKPHPD